MIEREVPPTDRATVAVVTGEHPFDVPAFHRALRATPEVDPYPQSLAEFVADAGDVRDAYDAVAFYNFHRPGGPPDDETAAAIEALGDRGQGIVVLHHGLVAFLEWATWDAVCGIADRSIEVSFDEELAIEVADADHPITEGLGGWTMVDETYTLDAPGDDSRRLLETDHPESGPAIAWTRRFRESRVLCFQSGHDDRAFADPHFRTVLGRGLLWAAGYGGANGC